MRKIFIGLMAIASVCAKQRAEAQVSNEHTFHTDSIINIMKRVADWQVAEFEQGRSKYPKMNWENGALYTGMVAFAQLMPDGPYYRFLYNIGEENRWDLGINRFHADDYCVGQTYAQMYQQYREPKMISKWTGLADSIVQRGFAESLQWSPDTVKWKNHVAQREWAWCDALYMGPPSLAYLSVVTGNNAYLKKADTLWWKTSDYLFDPKEALFFRDSRYFTRKEANGKKMFWSRGNGWVMGGLVRMLDAMPKDFQNRKKYINQYRQMAAKIALLQQPDGSWHPSLLHPEAYNVKETSGTGFFCYALAWGINNNILSPKKYGPVVQKAWAALASSVHPDGKLGYVQAIGDRPDKVDFESTNVYGVGAFLLAGSQMQQLLKQDQKSQ